MLFNFDEISRLNAKYIKTINHKSINNFSKNLLMKISGKLKNNINSVEEAEEWFEIIYGKVNFSKKINIDKNLINDLKDKLEENRYEWEFG